MVLTGATIGDLISELFSGMTVAIQGMANAVKEALTNLIFDGTGDSRVLSETAKYLFIVAGVGIAISLVFGVINLVRKH